jgi:hypothetical protein
MTTITHPAAAPAAVRRRPGRILAAVSGCALGVLLGAGVAMAVDDDGTTARTNPPVVMSRAEALRTAVQRCVLGAPTQSAFAECLEGLNEA